MPEPAAPARPLVSVVIPSFNHAGFIARAMQSVVEQTYPNWEMVVVDNHSQDDTDRVVGGFDDSRIRLFKIHNQGVIAASRNLGIREARGEWIAFLDADDCWYPRKLETLLAAIRGQDAYDVVSNDELMVDLKTGDKTVLHYGPYEPEFYRALLVEGNRLSPAATMIRHEFLRRHQLQFPESRDYITVEDYGLWLDLARSGARFKFIHEVQGEYVLHADNNSAQLGRHWKNTENLLRNHVFEVQRFHPSPAALWKIVSARIQMWRVRQLVRDRQWVRALIEGIRTITGSPAGVTRYALAGVKRRYRGTT